MSTFAVVAKHPPELCPASNATTRQMLREGAGQLPQLAERFGLEIVTLRVFGPDHVIVAVVEADGGGARLPVQEPTRAVEHREGPRDLLARRGPREVGEHRGDF